MNKLSIRFTLDKLMIRESDNSGQYRTFIAETEVEAIVKACEYILKEINGSK